MPPPAIIVDPNVWVSALISPGGTTAGVLRAVRSDEVIVIVTPHLLEDLSGVLERDKFRRWVSLADARAFVAALSDKADLRPDAGKPRRSARDPDDDYLVALVEETGAVIVTGDDDLLSLNHTPPAITPWALLDLLESLR